ncbi:MAG TPA: response regulator [Kofleriaceae bacterium]|nr:response regulator [Kofleriaceae bacterium]
MRALIVDDERLARNELRRLLEALGEVEVVGEARNADEAVEQIGRLRPDLLFLDIQMPGCDGFELLERLSEAPRVIFTTAFDRYALRAFEVSALDYLVKPIAPARLAAAVAKAAAVPAAGAADPAGPLGRGQRIFVRDAERCWFVAIEDIVLIESEGNYARLHFACSDRCCRGRCRRLAIGSIHGCSSAPTGGRSSTSSASRRSRRGPTMATS